MTQRQRGRRQTTLAAPEKYKAGMQKLLYLYIGSFQTRRIFEKVMMTTIQGKSWDRGSTCEFAKPNG